MKEDWTKQIKQKLEGHQMTPPAGLWEGISNQMGLEPAPAPKPTIIRRYYWAAAAIVLALVGFFVSYNFDDNQPKPKAHHEATAVSRPVTQEVDNQLIRADKPAIISKPILSGKLKLLAMTTQQTSIAETNNLDVIEEQPEVSIEEKVAPATEEKPEPQQAHQSEPKQKKQTYIPDVNEPKPTASYSESSSKWTIGLTGSNGLLLAANSGINAMNSQPLYQDASPADYYGTNNEGFWAQAYSRADFKAKHHIPVRIGLSLHYQLNNRLALMSGLNYTYLKSEFTNIINNMSYEQELSYIGIPLGISWELWSTEHFNIYLAGGIMLEKCVNTDTNQGDINQHPWQWSINGSAGIEYYFTQQLGVYLEPSLGYYFDDRTSIQHYYKEHKLAPSVQFGLRLHLK